MKPAKTAIYMDNHATTRIDPRVLEAMMPSLTENYGNPASRTHDAGWQAEQAVDHAREQVARLIGARAKEIVFTSGATEADNLAVKGVVRMAARKRQGKLAQVITVATEHHAVLDPCKVLEERGEAEILRLRPDAGGLIDPEAVRAAMTDCTVLVSVMHANNEIGVIAPIREIGAIARERGVFFHTDAAQSVGKIPFDVEKDCIDLASLSAHKFYGPKGVGALYVRARDPRVRLAAEMDGGGHERGMRSGTLNVPAIVGLGAACEIAAAERDSEAERVSALRDRLLERLGAEIDQIGINGDFGHRLPGNLNLSFACVEAESLLMGLRDIALSSGSACTSASLEPSYVLRALGLSDEAAHSSIRFGVGRFNTGAEIEIVADRVIAEVKRLRALSPHYKATKNGPGGRSEQIVTPPNGGSKDVDDSAADGNIIDRDRPGTTGPGSGQRNTA